MFSQIRSGRTRQGLVGLALAVGLLVAGCGPDIGGLPTVVEAGTPPPPPPLDAGPRQPPIIQTPDAGAVTPPDAREPVDTPPMIVCPSTNVQPGEGCAFGYHPLKRSTPEVVLVFDRSSAMLRPVSNTGQTLWGEMVAAVDESVKRTHAGLHWGLKMFPSVPATSMCDVSDPLDVTIGVSNYDPLVTRIRGSQPVMGPAGSPLDLGVKKAVNILKLRMAENPTLKIPRFLVLATDGIPNCPGGLPGQTEAIMAVSMAKQHGVRTFVIGTSAPANPQHRTLNDLAAAGGEPRAGEQRYYPALNKADMQKALDEITSSLGSCVFTFEAVAPWPDFVAMNIGNTRVPRDIARREGWDWGGSQVVHVYGEACESLKTNPLAVTELVFGCKGFLPPPPPPCTEM